MVPRPAQLGSRKHGSSVVKFPLAGEPGNQLELRWPGGHRGRHERLSARDPRAPAGVGEIAEFLGCVSMNVQADGVKTIRLVPVAS